MKLATLIYGVSLSALAAAPVDLEKILSAPFASELTAGPGRRVAWVVNAGGVRNVWVAAAPDYKGRAITQYKEDDGQEIGQLEWLPSGQGVVFVRGGDLEHPGSPNPDPLSRPEAIEQSIWAASLAGEPQKKLADGFAPAILDDRAVFIKGGQVWSVALAGADKPTQLMHTRGTVTKLVVSPDRKSLAVVSSRGDHGFIGVYAIATKEYRYLDPSLDTDLDPVWSPDSRSIAFIRIPAATLTVRFGPSRTAKQPWTIRIADVASGKSRRVFAAAAGPGSHFAIDSGEPLMWGDGRLVFPWERDGWLHLYSVSIDGGEASLLTPGEFEVEYMSLAPDRKSVVFSSNQDDIDRRHLWRVGLKPGDRPQHITTGTGIEWSPALLEDGSLAYLRSDTKLPARAAVMTAGANNVRDLAPELVAPDYPAQALADPQPVMISAADGMRIHAQIFLPPASSAQKHPALIFFHGGSRRQMLLGRHYMYYYSNAYAMNQWLASLGYVVLSVNYRSGIGYGLDFREAINYGASGASEYNDVVGAGLYMRARPDVDANRIGLWGGSYGGYLTALGLARGSDLFKAGVDFHGVHDWSKLRRGLDANADQMRIALESSPMASLDTWRSPVLLIHGDDDRNVPFAESVRLVEALRDRSVHVEQLVFPDEVHDFLTYGHWLQAYKAAAEFFARTL